MPTGVIRPATSIDAKQMVEIHRASIHAIEESVYDPNVVAAWASDLDEPTINAMAQSLETVAEHAFIAEFSSVPLGWFSLTQDGSHVRAFYVSPEYHRRGIGQALMAVAATAARSLGNQVLTIHASFNAVEFYKAQGFEEIEAVKVPVKKDLTIEALAMTLDLSAA